MSNTWFSGQKMPFPLPNNSAKLSKSSHQPGDIHVRFGASISVRKIHWRLRSLDSSRDRLGCGCSLADKCGVTFYFYDDGCAMPNYYNPATKAMSRRLLAEAELVSVKPDPKQETWRDRAIRDPLF